MVSEDSFLKKILPQLSKKNLLPGNDDAVAWKTPDFERESLLVLKTDSLAWSSDALPSTMTYKQFARKLVTVNVSDVVAKGATPYYFLCALTAPQDISDATLSEIFDGLIEGCNLYQVEYMGGDLGSSKELVLTGIVVGYVQENNLRKRSSMKPNDLICTTGLFGYTGLGFGYYLEHIPNILPKSILNQINQKLLFPKARQDWLLFLRKYANATIDSSDGLAKSLEHLSNESHMQIDIEILPSFPELTQIFSIDSKEFLKAVLFAGEEFEIIFSISENNFSSLLHELTEKKMEKPIVIGKANLGSGINYKGSPLQLERPWDSLSGQFKKL